MNIQMENGGTISQERRWAAMRGWLRANTFAPSWLKWSWSQHPAMGYLAAVLLQVAATMVTLLLIGIFPNLNTRTGLLILMIVLVALSWGAGPSLLATVTGVILLEYAVERPYFTWPAITASNNASTILFVTVGLTISIVGSQSEWRRRSAHAAAQRLEALQDVTEAALTHFTVDELLGAMPARITRALSVDNTTILLLDEAHHDRITHLAQEPAVVMAEQVRLLPGDGIGGRIAANRTPLIVDDVRAGAHPFFHNDIRSAMGVPLVVAGRLLGVLLVGTGVPHRFTLEDLQVLQLMGDRLALALNHAQGYEAEQAARADAVLRASEIEAVVEAMADAVFVYEGTGQIRLVNGAARALFGFAAQPDYPTRPLAERLKRTNTRDDQGRVLPPEQWPQLRVLRGDVFTGPQAMDLLISTLLGRDVRVNVSGAPVRDASGAIAGGVLVLRDVTERRTLERRTHEALDALLAMAQTLVVTLESDPSDATETDGRSLVGQRLVELTRNVLGCQRVGLTTFDLQQDAQHAVAVAGLSPEQEQAWRSSVEGAPLNDPRAPTDPDLVARFYAGNVLIVDMTKPPYHDQPNPFGIRTVLIAPLRLGVEVMGALSLDYGGVDHVYTPEEITLAAAVAQLAALALERDRLQKEREEARAAALALSETNQRMDEFLSIASHELKTPLTSIRGNVQLSRRRIERARRESDMTTRLINDALIPLDTLLQRTEAQIERQTRLIDDLLDLSRMQTGHLELQMTTLDLTTLVREEVDEQRLAWPERDLAIDLPAGPVMVLADAGRIAQVLGNFISNAFKYSSTDNPVTVTLQVAANAATVLVRDTGPGVPLEEQQLIWERYRRGPGSTARDDAQVAGGGLGLGLYISRTLIEQHRGQVGMESTPGQGATFWFRLPFAEP